MTWWWSMSKALSLLSLLSTTLSFRLTLKLTFLLSSTHSLWHSRRLGSPTIFKEPLPQERATKPPAYHRLVQQAPAQGRKALYIAAHAKLIVGWSYEDSQKLIWKLIDWCTQPKYVFSMEWLDGGDMVWWDNR